MLSDWLSELAGSLFGGLIGDELIEGRAEKTVTKQLAAFSAGGAVAIPCAFRESTGAGWRHGRLELSKGRAAWTRRFGKAPELVLGRGEATALHSRVNSKLVVLAYRRGESTIEFAVRHRDLRVVARVLEIPAVLR